MNTSTASGNTRYQRAVSAFHALGISERFMPLRPYLPASRCTIQNAEAKYRMAGITAARTITM